MNCVFQELACGNLWRNSLVLSRFELTPRPGIEHLAFGEHYQQPLDGVRLPSNLKSLTFGERFDKSLEKALLPASLLELNLGRDFNKPLQALPSSLQSLTFGPSFNQTVQCLEAAFNLVFLTFGVSFDQPLGCLTLPKLRNLSFGALFDQSLSEVSFPSLENLTFGVRFNQRMDLPSQFPSLQTLTMGYGRSLEEWTLPRGLKELNLGSNERLELIKLPDDLSRLQLGHDFNLSLASTTFPALQTLIFGARFNQPLNGVRLPASLKELTLGRFFNRSLDDAWKCPRENCKVLYDALTLGSVSGGLPLHWETRVLLAESATTSLEGCCNTDVLVLARLMVPYHLRLENCLAWSNYSLDLYRIWRRSPLHSYAGYVLVA